MKRMSWERAEELRLPCCSFRVCGICLRSGVINVCTHPLANGVKAWSSKPSSGPPAKDVEFLVVLMSSVGFIVLLESAPCSRIGLFL